MNVIASRMASLRGDLRKAHRQKRRQTAAAREKESRVQFHKQVAAQLVSLCMGRGDAALQYLEQQNIGRDDEEPWTSSEMLGWARATAAESSTGAEQEAAEPSARLVSEAAERFWAEKQVYQWVRHQNEAKGLTPQLQTTVGKFTEIRQVVDPAEKSPDVPKTVSGKYKWVRRWARRWQVHKGELKAVAWLPLEQRRVKAARLEKNTAVITDSQGSPHATRKAGCIFWHCLPGRKAVAKPVPKKTARSALWRHM